MNSAVLAPTASSRRIRRWTLPGRILRSAALAVARVRSTRLEGMDPRELHELQREADSLRTEQFRTVAVGRLI
jgi:hypothetical protein